MVSKMKSLKKLLFFAIYSLLVLSFSQVVLSTKAHAATLASSSDPVIKSLYIKMSDYPINGSNWPSRYNDGCGGSPAYPLKVFPWLGQYQDEDIYDGDPLGTGNYIDEVGNCSNKYLDGGTNTTPLYTSLAGPWISPAALGGWANGGGGGWGAPVDTQAGGCIVDSDVLRPGFTQAHLWGSCDLDYTNQSDALYSKISVPFKDDSSDPGFDGMSLYSNGTTLFYQEFNLTNAQLNALNNNTESLYLDIQADDWFVAYINGVNIAGHQVSAEPRRITIADTSTLVAGTNKLAIQVIDKAVWIDSVSNPLQLSRNSGVSYQLSTISNSAVRYDLDPDYTISPDGRTIDFSVVNSGGGTSRKADGFGVTVTREVYINNFPISLQPPVMNDQQIVGGENKPYQYLLPNTITLNVGDDVCAYIKVEPASGITDGAVDSSIAEKIKEASKCVTISSKPYFRAYGNDVIVGRNFANPSGCIVNSGVKQSIRAFNSNSGSGWSGAGVQFAASATGIIDGFMSASMHSGSPGTDDIPKPNAGLTFSNPDSYNLGNDEGAYKGCMGDYKSLANDIVAKGIDSWKDASNFTLYSGNLNELDDHILLIKGNLYINTNIPSSPTGDPSYSSISDIKTNLIIVQGNIFISPVIKDIDGLFIALKDSNSGFGGVINTCGNTDTPVGNCKSESLTIHGAFLADEVKLNRIIGDYAKATSNETSSEGNIAEKFIFTPDFYLGLINNLKSVNEINNATSYDIMTSMPAVL